MIKFCNPLRGRLASGRVTPLCERSAVATVFAAALLVSSAPVSAAAALTPGQVTNNAKATSHNASIDLTGFTSRSYLGSKQSVSATVKYGKGRTVTLETERGSRWFELASTHIGNSGKITLRHAFGLGLHTLRLTVTSSHGHKAVHTSPFITKVVSLPPPPPPAPAPATTDTLGDLSVTSGEFSSDYDTESGAEEVNGVNYPHSLLLNCGSDGGYAVTVDTGKAWKSLHTVLGLRDDSTTTAYGLVEIFGDGKLLFRQQVNFATGTPIDLDLSGVVALTFRATCAGSGQAIVTLGSPTVSSVGSAHPSAHAGPSIAWLTDNDPVSSVGSHNPYNDDRALYSVSGHPLGDSLGFNFDDNGQTCNNCESDSSVSYNLGRSATRLTGFLGFSDIDDTEGSAVITFAVDGTTLGHYSLRAGTFTPFDLNVTNGLRLTITVSSPDGATCPVIGDIRVLTGGDLAPSLITATPTYL